MVDHPDFIGAKLAILSRGRVLTVLRDDIAGIDWPGCWDLPGGGREGGESPEDCALRECREELGLALPASALVWRQMLPRPAGGMSWLFVCHDEAFDARRIAFGDEGQGWTMMRTARFVAHPRAVPHLAERLGGYLAGTGGFPKR